MLFDIVFHELGRWLTHTQDHFVSHIISLVKWLFWSPVGRGGRGLSCWGQWPTSILLCCHSIAWSCCSKPEVHIHQQIFESSSTQTGCPVLCTCKLGQDSGRCRLESVGLCFVWEALPFPGGFCFAPASSAPVTACTVAELYFLYRVKVNSCFIYYQGVLDNLSTNLCSI